MMNSVMALCMTAIAAAADANHVLVPGGRLVHRSCVHEVPSGTDVSEDDGHFVFTFPNGTVARQPLCPSARATVSLGVGHGNAWKAWAQFSLPGSTAVTSLKNTWIVPEDPTSKGAQILYYWNGIEDGDSAGGSGVLQPVLEWRQSSGWGIKSWYVGAGGTVTSNLVAVKPGDKIIGTMDYDGKGWTCTGQAQDGSPATLKYSRSMTFTFAYEVLEAYYVGSSCSMYDKSGGVTFTDTQVAFDGKDATDEVQWVAFSCPSGPGCTGTAECGEQALISGKDVTISYRTSTLV
jgi:hypothetical protein